MTKHIQLLTLFVLCNFLSTSAFAAWHEPYNVTTVVKPGRSIGAISIGMSNQTVRKLIGQPTSKLKNCDQFYEISDEGIPSMLSSGSYMIRPLA